MLVLLTSIMGCKKKEEAISPPKCEDKGYKYSLYQNNASNTSGLQGKLTDCSGNTEIFRYGSFGSDGKPDGLNMVSFHKPGEAFAANTLMDEENGEIAFIYASNFQTGDKENEMVEFEKVDATHFFINNYEYNWTTGMAVLKKRIYFTFENDKFTGETKFTGRSTPAPLLRLHQLLILNKDRNSPKNKQNLRGTQSCEGISANFMNAVFNNTSNVIVDGIAGYVGGAAGFTLLFGTSTALTGGVAGLALGAGIALFHNNATLTNNVLDCILSLLVSEAGAAELPTTNIPFNPFPSQNVDLPSLFRVTLTWDNATDQDLHLIDPNNEEIYYGHKVSVSGGMLDVDDISGYGPENIFWATTPPNGSYKISVVDYTNGGQVNGFTVKIKTPTQEKVFTGSTANGSRAQVATVIKNGDSYTIQ